MNKAKVRTPLLIGGPWGGGGRGTRPPPQIFFLLASLGEHVPPKKFGQDS